LSTGYGSVYRSILANQNKIPLKMKDDASDAIVTSNSNRAEEATWEHLSPVESSGKDTADQGMRKGSLICSDRFTIHSIKDSPSIIR